MFTIACIPTFNEEKVIADLIKGVAKYVDSVIVCEKLKTGRIVGVFLFLYPASEQFINMQNICLDFHFQD